jgi:PAS domain S-box-containing protein
VSAASERKGRDRVRNIALIAVMILVTAIWMSAAHIALGTIRPQDVLVEAISDIVPIIVIVLVGTTIGNRRAGHLERTLAALQASEVRARELIEESGDGILVSEASGRYVEVNPALCRMLGYSRDQLLGMQAGDLTADDDPVGNTGMDERLGDAAAEEGILVERRYRKRDGASLPVEVRFKVLPDGRQQRNVRDISERMRTESERSRLVDGLRMSERNLAEAQRIAHIGSWAWDLATDTAVRSDETYRIVGVEPGAFPGTNEAFLAFVHPDERAQVQASERAAISGGARYDLDYRLVRPDGVVRIVQEQADLVRDPAGKPLRWVGTLQDITERVAADEEHARLVAAVEQTADAVWIKDSDGSTITYVNPAFCRLYGYERDEIVGQGASILSSGRHETAFFDAIWAAVATGRTWAGTLVNRRKDGTLVEVEAVISGIRDASDRLVSYMQTDRDVTRERALENALARRARERDIIAAALDRIDSGSTPEAMAAVACAEMIKLPDVGSAFVVALDGEDHGLVLAVEGPVAAVFASNRVIPGPRTRYLFEHASTGVWTEDWRARDEDGTYGERVAATGLRTVAYAPLYGPSGVIGVVGFGIHDRALDSFVEQLPVLATFASILAPLLSPELEARYREDDVRASVQAILDTAAFKSFYQPIVELHTGAVVGYEALSRFADGTPPDVLFALAVRSGLGLELETATLRAALEAATILPPRPYLSVNVSPALIGSGRLQAVLGGQMRKIVLEITEHVLIQDYPALRRELAALGPTLRLAVDDAGAGYASLRHILELAPDFVKLDVGLIRGIDADPARQALIAGMGYFAVKRKLRLVAEGIETAAELEMLRSLGIGYGQGYLFGRPQDGRGPGPWPTKIVVGQGGGP